MNTSSSAPGLLAHFDLATAEAGMGSGAAVEAQWPVALSTGSGLARLWLADHIQSRAFQVGAVEPGCHWDCMLSLQLQRICLEHLAATKVWGSTMASQLPGNL